MSFPRLVIDGELSERSITSIGVTYDNDTALTKPAYLTRSNYNVKRDTRLKNVSGGTAERYPEVNYDRVRLIHTWQGYIDVLTESVSITADSTIDEQKTVALLKTAVILNIATGIDHTIASFFLDQSVLGPDKASLDGEYTQAFDAGLEWTYNVTSDGATPKPAYTYDTTFLWLIRNTNIVDNANNTSRVTFNFEIIEPWESIPDIIDGLT